MMSRISRVCLLLTGLACLAWLIPAVQVGSARADVVNTRHNLSVSGPGTVKALEETRVCVFCHTPHSASTEAQLWNRNSSAAGYTPYTSSTLDALAGQPTGSSRLCLGCHDGTIALGSVISESTVITMAGGVTVMPDGDTNLNVDLHDDHPFSFLYDAALAASDGQLIDPAVLPAETVLDPSGEIQCTTCHDPHDDANGFFLVLPGDDAGLCEACHSPDQWASASHNTPLLRKIHSPAATATATDSAHDKGIPSTNSCLNCHDAHGGDGGARLLAFAREEEGCIVCHGVTGPASDIESELGKFSAHPVALTDGVHDPREALPIASAHVECVDCHNPHATRAEATNAPDVPGALSGVRGLNGDNVTVEEAAYTYEVCYKCHAGSAWRPGPATPRQVVQSNSMLEFDPGNPSFHPVEGPGNNPNVPSLLHPYTETSIITCTDCHNSSGDSPAGLHGSDFPHLLGWNYETAQGTIESYEAYELCYRCHDRTTILSNASWQSHRKHVVNEGFSCNSCHDPHGISATQGDESNHSRLINFDLTYVEPEDDTGLLEFVDNGGFGTCTLKCHGDNHRDKNW
ncbi:MAG: hypothetical protein KOO60_08645 [Gemmatimonadales bacterium]|nr:hypothetical protein [Gemmatimonadales bacterium]